MAFSALEALQAFGAGRQLGLENTQRSAAQAYANGDPRGLATITGINPQLGMELQDHQDRRAQLEMQIRQGALQQHQASIMLAGSYMDQNPVTDEASYQRALGAVANLGGDVSHAPPHFDPQYVTDLQHAYHVLKSMQPGYDVAQGAVHYTGDNQPIAHGGAPPPTIVPVVPNGGTVMRWYDPATQTWHVTGEGGGDVTPGAPAPPARPTINGPHGPMRLNAAGDGWEPVPASAAAVNQGGASPSNGSGGFRG